MERKEDGKGEGKEGEGEREKEVRDIVTTIQEDDQCKQTWA